MSRRSVVQGALALCLLAPSLAACSPAAPAAPTTSAPTSVPAAAPTAAPTVATAPTNPPAAPAATQPPTPAPSPTPSLLKRTTQAAAYYTDERGRPQGSLHPFTVSIQPGPREQEFRLGFFETNVGQLGGMWRAAGWMASSVGAFETGKDINTLRVSWETTGRIDGPSAGGIMTAAFISGILGHELNKDVAFTGTINPDGSIGPVGGILYKMEAAIKEGKKTFLIPIGQRYATDEETGETVDVIQKGQLSNLKVQEVSTLDEAYEVMTGKTLPRVQAPARAPELSPAAYDRMRPKVLEWKAEYGDAMGRFRSLNPQVQDFFEENLVEIEALAKKSDADLNQGSVAAAYGAIQEATVGANTLALGGRAVEVLLQTGDFRAAENAIIQGAGASRVQPLLERLKALQPNTPEDAVLAIRAWSDLVSTIALDQGAQRELRIASASKDDEVRFTHLFTAAALHSAQRYTAKAAEDVLSFNFGTGKTSTKKVDPQVLESWAGVFTRAAEANLSYFDSIVLDQAAAAAGVRADSVKESFQGQSLPYVVASFGASPGAQEYLEKNIGKGPGRSYAQLGFAVASYLASSSLVTEHYSLGAQVDDEGNVVGFRRERALTAMLDSASDRARERIAAVEKAGGDPSLPIVLFQAGRAEREGSNDNKISALGSYWAASTYARLLSLIAEGSR